MTKPPPHTSPNALSAARIKLLFIDDDQSVLQSLHTLFDMNYETYSAASVDEGLRMVEKTRPNLIILDLKLPDGNGIDILREIRRKDTSIPVIVLTGYSTLAMAEECVRLGATDYLNKPFDSKQLTDRVAQFGLTAKVSSKKQEYQSFVSDSLQVMGSFRDLQNASAAFLHDVSGPLSCLMAGSDLLAEVIASKDVINTDEISDSVEMMSKSVHYLRSLVQQWRSFSDLHSLMHGKCKAREAIDFALSQVMGQIVSTGVSVQLQTPKIDVFVPGNDYALSRVLINLLKNAVEATGNTTGRVHVVAEKTADRYSITISDNGPGIKQEQANCIFDSGFTTKVEGIGMGLFIARKLVEALGGEIRVVSPGILSGCDFILTLPCV